MALIDWLIIVVYFAVVLGVGAALRRFTRTSTDFFMAGRALPAWVCGLAFLSANLGAQEVIGRAASGAKYGVATGHFYWIGAIPAMVFVGIFMMPFYYGSRARSVPEYLRLRGSASHASVCRRTATCTRMRRVLCLVVLLASACGSDAPRDGDAPTIAVIPKGTSHVFWQSIHAGAVRAARETGVTIVWRGPLREDDRDSQISEVESAVSRGVAGIVLAPLDEAALVGPVTGAVKGGVPVVIIDSGLKSDDYVSFVATDNEAGGRLGGDHLAKLLGGKGKVVLLRYAEGSESTERREDGFLAAIREHSGIQIVSDNQYGGADVEGAYKKGEALLSRFKNADGSLAVDGIFCPNESTTFAMMRVLQDNGWAGKVRFVGFDSSDNLAKGLRDGHIDGLVLQDPMRMGYLGVKTMVSHLKGEKVERRVDTGVRLITPDTMDQPDMKELLHPDVGKWLKQ